VIPIGKKEDKKMNWLFWAVVAGIVVALACIGLGGYFTWRNWQAERESE
jgi:predicted negative regulator of RcsB-dependent stress response